MKILLTFATLIVLATAGYPQAVNPPGQSDGKKGDDQSSVADAERSAVDLAKQRAKSGDAAGVEEAVAAINVAKKNTAEWYLETAQRMMLTAEDLAREGKGEQVAALAHRAIQNLNLAETKAKDTPTKAAAKTLAGFIQERYLADTTAAIVSYEGAVQLAPTEAKGAKEAAERLRRTEENQKNRTPDKLKEKIDNPNKGAGGGG